LKRTTLAALLVTQAASISVRRRRERGSLGGGCASTDASTVGTGVHAGDEADGRTAPHAAAAPLARLEGATARGRGGRHRFGSMMIDWLDEVPIVRLLIAILGAVLQVRADAECTIDPARMNFSLSSARWRFATRCSCNSVRVQAENWLTSPTRHWSGGLSGIPLACRFPTASITPPRLGDGAGRAP